MVVFFNKISSPKALKENTAGSYKMLKHIKKVKSLLRKKDTTHPNKESPKGNSTSDLNVSHDIVTTPPWNGHDTTPYKDFPVRHGSTGSGSHTSPDPATELPQNDSDIVNSKDIPVHHEPAASGVTATPNTATTPPQKKCERLISDAVSVCAKLGAIPEEKQTEIVMKVNNVVLAQPEHFYDFCMVSSEEDYEKAKKLKDEISAEFNLRGCTIYEDDFFQLGRDSFEGYERMMDRSTKIFFYITPNLNENEFCRRLQSASVYQGLMSKVQKEKEKCVPVFPNGLCRVPLPLSGIGGLEMPNKSLTAQRLRITYTDKVRNQRVLQEQDRQRKCFNQILNEEVKKYLQEEKHKVLENGSTSSDSDDEDNSENIGKKFTSIPQKMCKIPTPSGMLNDVQEFVKNATSAPVLTSSEVNIDSTTAHIGHNITINVHCHQTQNEVDHSDTSDSSSTCSDL